MSITFPLLIQVTIGFENGCFVVKFCRHPKPPKPPQATHIVSTGSVQRVYDAPPFKFVFSDKYYNTRKNQMDLIVGVNKGSIVNVPEDANNQPRAVDGDIQPSVDVEGIATFVTEDGGKTFQVIPVAPGTVTFIAKADADLGPGNTPIVGNTITVNVAPAPIPQATHIVSTEGPVIPQ